uniref:Uncharacterized protein n=1 Tax=Arundo donax TaxID=35708 RepID=A0A0A8YQM5_ARUDO
MKRMMRTGPVERESIGPMKRKSDQLNETPNTSVVQPPEISPGDSSPLFSQVLTEEC